MDKDHTDSKERNGNTVGALSAQPLKIATTEFATGELGEVQEILFGRQIRANTEQVAKLNNHIEDRLTRLSDTCQQQFLELREQISTSVDSLKLSQSESDEKCRAQLSTMSQTHASLETSMLSKFRESSDQSSTIQKRLNSQLEQSSTELSKSLDTTRQDLTAMLNEAVEKLQTNKLDRAALSTLLGTVATHLSNGNQTAEGTQTGVKLDTTFAPDDSIDSQ